MHVLRHLSAAGDGGVTRCHALQVDDLSTHAVAEGVAFDSSLTDSAETSQQLCSHPATTPRTRSTAARRLFASTQRADAASTAAAADLMAEHSGPMSKSMAAGTMRRMLQSVGDSESELLGSVRDSIAAKAAPNQLLQLLLIVKRTAIKRFRDFFPTTVIDICLLLAAACVVGAIHGTDWTLQRFPANTVMAVTTLCTLTSATFLRSFTRVRMMAPVTPGRAATKAVCARGCGKGMVVVGVWAETHMRSVLATEYGCLQEQHMYWREASKGLQTLPYFLGISLVDMYYVVLVRRLPLSGLQTCSKVIWPQI